MVQKNQNFQFKLKFGAKSNLNMQNSMPVFTFSVFPKKSKSLGCLLKDAKPVVFLVSIKR